MIFVVCYQILEERTRRNLHNLSRILNSSYGIIELKENKFIKMELDIKYPQMKDKNEFSVYNTCM